MRTTITLAVALFVVSTLANPAAASWPSSASGPATARADTLLPPTNLTATCLAPLLNAQVVLQWSASASPWVEGYEVLRGTSSGNYTTSVFTTNLTYTTQNLSLGTHYFAVRATKADWRSALSNEDSASIISILFIGLRCDA